MGQQRAGQIKALEANQRTVASPSRQPPLPVSASNHQLLQLHSMIGNRAMGLILQAKLRINELGDEYEQKADRVAEMVMKTPEPIIQRKPT